MTARIFFGCTDIQLGGEIEYYREQPADRNMEKQLQGQYWPVRDRIEADGEGIH